MSVRRRGKQFEVRWAEGGRKLSRSFVRAEDARAFDLDIKRRKQLGALAPGIIQSRQTLAEFMEQEWWPRYAIPNLAPGNDGLKWPQCDGLNWPHLRPTGGRLFDAHRARAEGARGNGIQGGAVRADQTGS
jgi:hypothetical protein